MGAGETSARDCTLERPLMGLQHLLALQLLLAIAALELGALVDPYHTMLAAKLNSVQ